MAAVGLQACASAPPAENYNELVRIKTFQAPIGQPLTVQTGDPIYVEGRYISGEAFNLSKNVHVYLPGSLHVPFPVSIDAGMLRMRAIRGNWKYFCARPSTATASFPGMGSVVAPGDCIGLRQSLRDGQLEWVVDNSHYTHTTTVWSRFIAADEAKLLHHVAIRQPFFSARSDGDRLRRVLRRAVPLYLRSTRNRCSSEHPELRFRPKRVRIDRDRNSWNGVSDSTV